LKASASDEVERMETLNASVAEIKTRLEEASKLLIVKQNEVENLKKEIERKHKEHEDFKNEMMMAIDKTREEIKIVNEKQEKMDSERDKKRQVIIKLVKALVS
jgi:predicted  nucleic acid-binding Zn-ribbon protein